MAFNNFDHMRGMGRQYEGLSHTLNQYVQIMRPYERTLESHGRIMQSIESPLLRTLRDVQAVNGAAGTLHSHVQAMADAAKPASATQQIVADGVQSLNLAKAYGMDGLAARVACSSSTAGGFQDIVSKIIGQQQPYQGLINTMVEQKLRPLQTLAERVAAAGLLGEVTRDSWRPVLMRGFESPTMSAISQITNAVDDHNGSLAKMALRSMTPAIDAYQESQARQAQNIISAITAAAKPSPTLQQLSGINSRYRLRDAWTAPVIPEQRTPTYRMPTYHPPTIEPEPFTAFPRVEAPPAETPPVEVLPKEDLPELEQGAESAPVSEDVPRQLTGRWQVLRPLQPVENAVYAIIHGPLIVKIFAIGLGEVVVFVICDGVITLLHYCCW